MKLIVGLGNPGDIYRDSRHNIGFQVIKRVARAHKITLRKERKILCLSGKGKINHQDVVLAMPLTFMNLSGEAVSALLKKYKAGLVNLLVVSDDLDLEFGRLKLRPSGSSGGHRGLNSIIKSLESSDFARLRIGISRPKQQDLDTTEYVLAPFSKREKTEVKRITEEAHCACQVWLEKGIQKAMNNFNRRDRHNE